MKADGDVLLVDDNQADVKLTLKAFRVLSSERQVTVVRDGEKALELLFSTGRHSGEVGAFASGLRLVLLDLKLPKVNGFEVLKAVKADPKTQSIPVVMLTSSNQAQDVHECYRLGANSYIQKPVDYDEFCEAIQQIERYWLLFNQTRPLIREDQKL
jgi:two-component system, response regulator